MSESQEYSLTLTDGAIGDIDRLDLFLRPLNPNAADRFQDVLWDSLNSLMEMPRIGEPWPEAPPDQEIRELQVSFGKRGYVVRYRIKGREIVVVRIHHFREDRRPGV